MPLTETPPRLDSPGRFGATPAKASQSFREMRFANRWFGGARSVLAQLPAVLGNLPDRELRVLDAGSGAGDIPLGLAAWARGKGLACRIVALDRHPEAVRATAAAAAKQPEIATLRGDALSLPFGSDAFDVALSAMLLHYFSDEDAARLLSELARVARGAVIVADVERHWLPCRAIDALSALSGNRLVRREWKGSVLRGFTPAELDRLADSAGLCDRRVVRRFPFRLVLVGKVAAD